MRQFLLPKWIFNILLVLLFINWIACNENSPSLRKFKIQESQIVANYSSGIYQQDSLDISFSHPFNELIIELNDSVYFQNSITIYTEYGGITEIPTTPVYRKYTNQYNRPLEKTSMLFKIKAIGVV